MRIGLLCLVATCAACNSKSDAEKFVDDFCVEVIKCCTQVGLGSADWMCHKRMTMASAGGTYNASEGNACLAEVRAQQSAGVFCSGQKTTPSCDAVYTTVKKGTTQPGEPCNADSDCAPSSDGDVGCASLYLDSTLVQKCQVRVQGKAGDSPCVGTKSGSAFSGRQPSGATDIAPRAFACDHADNLKCKDEACVALSEIGSSCKTSDDCVANAYCNDSTGLCATLVAVGGACTDSECAAGAYCDSNTGTCVAKVAGGKACATSDECLSDNCASGVCQGTGNTTLDLMCTT